MAADLRQRVALERKLRYVSDREAATAGGVSNSTWSRYMQTGEVTPKVRRAIATAFDWQTDWPENPPPSPLTPSGRGGNAPTAGEQAGDSDLDQLLATILGKLNENQQAMLTQLDRIERKLGAPTPPREPREQAKRAPVKRA